MKLDLTVGQRLAAGLGLLLAVLAAFLLLVLRWSSQGAAAQDAYLQQALPLARLTDEMERRILYVGIAARAYLMAPDPVTRERYEERAEMLRVVERAEQDLPMAPVARERLVHSLRMIDGYLAALERAMRDRGGGPVDLAVDAELAAPREAALDAVREMRELQEQEAKAALAALTPARERAVRGVSIAGGVALVAFLMLAWLVSESIRRPTKELIRISNAMERGDFAAALDIHAPPREPQRGVRDEMSRLRNAFGSAAFSLMRRERRLRAEGAVAAATSSSLEAREIAAAALPAIVEKVGAELAAIHGVVTTGRLVPLASHAFLPDPAGFLRGEGIPGEAAARLRTVIVRDIPADSPLQVRLGHESLPPRCVVAVPIGFRGELRGVLMVASLRELDAFAVDFLESAARQLGVGLQNAREHEHGQRLLADVQERNERIEAQNAELQVQSEEIQAQNEELQTQGEELQAQNDDLSRQGEELRLAGQALAEADARKNDFLGVLAHELRNPIAAVAASLHVLRRAGASGATGERALGIIDRQSRHLTRLIADLLDVTRITHGKVRLLRERVDLRDVVRACADDHRAAIEAAGLTLELGLPEHPVPVDGDTTRLHQIAGNLLGNAIKFTPQGGAISMLLRERGEHVALRVLDTGEGITSDLLPDLFTPFRQGSTALAGLGGGLGLGLALVRRLAELHGGRVEARSEGAGRGSEFVVTLPRARAEVAPALTATPRLAGRAPMRILVIEDNRDVAGSLLDALELEGHTLELATTGTEGLAKALVCRPDVVLCDIGLPGMDGFEVARAFRRHPDLRATRLVALSGYSSEADRQKAQAAGFDRHLAKPADLERLLDTLGELSPMTVQSA